MQKQNKRQNKNSLNAGRSPKQIINLMYDQNQIVAVMYMEPVEKD